MLWATFRASTSCPFPTTVSRTGGSRSQQSTPRRREPTEKSIRLALEDQNIEARPAWKPMHQQPLFADAESVGGAVSDAIFELGICLPTGSALADAQVDRVIDVVLGQVEN